MTFDKNKNIQGDQLNLAGKILEQIPVGVISFSADWQVEFVNENFIKFGVLYYYDFNSLPGSNILTSELFPGINLKEELLQLEEGYSFEREIKSICYPDKRKISLVIKASSGF